MSAPLGIIAPHPPIMVPEVGGREAAETSRSAAALRTARQALESYGPDSLVVMSPHAPAAYDAFLVDPSAAFSGDLSAFRAPRPRLEARGDAEFAGAIIDAAREAELPVASREGDTRFAPGALDHGCVVPLSFLDPESRYPLVVLSLSGLPLSSHRRFGAAVRTAAERLGRRAAFLASGDCSHRLTRDAAAGFDPRGAEFDRILVESVDGGDLGSLERIDPRLIEAAGECGLRSFITLGGFIGDGAASRVLAYEGPWGVGYLTALAGDPAFIGHDATPAAGVKAGHAGDAESEPVALARAVIETWVRSGRALAPTRPAGLLAGRAGAFVSLHRAGALRGCIGTIGPTQPTLADEIAHNAVQAAARDPRFEPLSAAELDDLEISVDILGQPESATLADLDPRVWGVIVAADRRRGLLLPDLEGVDTAEEQIAIARRKAGIGPHEHVTLERFRVDRYR